MSQHDMVIADGSGAAVRADLNAALLALTSLQAGAVDPITAVGVTYAYQLWVDSSGGSPLLKIRNGANNAWITLGDVSLANLGNITAAAGGIFAAAISFSNTDDIKLPIGTTGQRPGSPANGMVRFNSTLGWFECYTSVVGWLPFGNGAIGSLGIETLTTARALLAADNGKIFLANSASGAIAITLPASPSNFKFIVKDIGGLADTNNITIVRNASENIEGISATLILEANYGNWAFASDGSNNFWLIQ